MRKLHCTGDASWALQSSWQDVDFKRSSFPPKAAASDSLLSPCRVQLTWLWISLGPWQVFDGTDATWSFWSSQARWKIKNKKRPHRVVMIGPSWTILDRLFSASFSFSTPKQMATVAPDLHCHPHLAAADAGCSIWGILSTGTMSDARC